MAAERAVLAGGGCCVVHDLAQDSPASGAVASVISGGDLPNATYRNHGTHSEAVEIEFDQGKITYRGLLEFSSRSTKSGQRNDIGSRAKCQT